MSTTHGFERLRFTDPLRDMLAAGFALPSESVDGSDRERPLERLGGCHGSRLFAGLTGWARNMSGLLLPREWTRRFGEATADFVLADDIQRLSEAEAVWAAGGIVVRVVRPGHTPHKPRSDREMRGPTIVERQAEICADLELINDDGFEALELKTDALAHELRARVRASADA